MSAETLGFMPPRLRKPSNVFPVTGPKRICSLVPSATEIVAMLGLADRLVGVSAECDWPTDVKHVPVVTASRIDTETLDERDIDQTVREAIAHDRSLYAIDEKMLDLIDPDLVITQDLCEVCAVSSGEVESLQACRADVFSLDPRSVREIEESICRLADRLEVPDEGRALSVSFRDRIADVEDAVAGLPERRVFVSEWFDPPYASGHWLPELTRSAGGQDVLGRFGEPAFPTTWDAVVSLEPELVVLAACGLDAERAAAAPLPELPFSVVAVDANAYYSRPSPRLADGVEQLAHLFHPEAVPDPGLPAVELRPG